MFNRLQIRVLIIIFGIVLVFIAGLTILIKWERNNLNQAVNDFQRQQHDLLYSVINMISTNTESLSKDYSHWDEMVDFIEKKDTIWAEINLKNTLSNFNTDHEWILNADLDLIYYSTGKKGSDLSNLLPDKIQLADVLRENWYLHFFQKTREGLVEIYGAPVQPMSDKERKSKPLGWLFAGKVWSDSLVKEISKMTSSELTLDTSSLTSDRNSLIDLQSALVSANFVLEGWSGRPVGVIRSVTTFPFLINYKLGSTYFIYISIFFVIVLFIVISIMFVRFVESPLRILNKTLELRDLRYLEPLKNYRSEFGRLTRSVQSIFDKEELLLETEKRRHLESDLRKSEQRFHLLVENLPDILWIADAKGDTFYYSSNISHVIGYQAVELIDHPEFWENNIHPDDYQKVMDRYSAFVNQNIQFEVEYRLKHKNGKYLWISEKAISKFELDGKRFCCGRLSDITLEKSVELRLFESEQHFRALFEQNPFGVAIMELEKHQLIRVNPALCQMLGYHEMELLGKQIEELTPDEDIGKEMRKAIDSREEGSSVFNLEKRLYKKDGDLIWVNLTGSYITDASSSNKYGFGIVENITEKKTIQDNLAREHNLLVSLMENVPDLIFFKDRDGRYIAANQAAIDFFGKMSVPDPIGLTDREILFQQDNMEEIREDDFSIMQSGKSLVNKVERIVMPGDDVVWFSTTKIPILSPDGKNDILVGILRNITERIENEIKLSNYAQELKELNLSKDKFVSILAHDLKNPFNAILGFSSVLAEEYEDYTDAERIHFIMNIRHAAENTFNLIQNILEWSRAQTGRISFQPDYLDLSNIVNESIKLLKPIMEEKGGKVISKIQYNTNVYCDENMLKTVLRNLISNAIKFSPRESIVRIYSRQLTHGMMEVTVEDEGIGIPEDALERLFKIDDSYRREGTEGEQGTGLGLILCKEFIEKNGGLIWVSTQEGKGSKFMFTIPIKSDEVLFNINSTES